MKKANRITAMGVAMTASLALVGCSDKKTDVQPKMGQEVVGPAWTLQLNSKCAADVKPEECTAAHGFSVSEDGTYQVGPAAGIEGGEAISGKLTEEQIGQIRGLLATASAELAPPAAEAPSAEAPSTEVPVAPTEPAPARAAAPAPADSCFAQPESDTEDTITLQRLGQEGVVLIEIKKGENRAGSQLCGNGLSAETSASLLDALRTLAKEYYPLPFPNACITAGRALENEYSAARSCSNDAECVYVHDVNFKPISVGEGVVTSECEGTSPLGKGALPLIVANRARVESDEAFVADLLGKYNAAKDACAAITARSFCGDRVFKDATELQAPRCVQNTCQLVLADAS